MTSYESSKNSQLLIQHQSFTVLASQAIPARLAEKLNCNGTLEAVRDEPVHDSYVNAHMAALSELTTSLILIDQQDP